MPEGKVFRLASLSLTEISKGAVPRLIAGGSVLLSFIEIGPMVESPLHSHQNEQVIVVLDGSLAFTLADRSFEVRAGDVCVIPPSAVHGGWLGRGG